MGTLTFGSYDGRALSRALFLPYLYFVEEGRADFGPDVVDRMLCRAPKEQSTQGISGHTWVSLTAIM
eukprot:scaffold293445_cov21-Prasinocladus_malaysianus.AAC.1